MLESLYVENYRGLRSFELDDLAPITLIGGRNGSGKTSVLEAIFLALGSHRPEILLNSHVTRMENLETGLSVEVPVPGSFPPAEPYWAALFTDQDSARKIRIKIHDDQYGTLSVTLSRDDSSSSLSNVPIPSILHEPASDQPSQPRLQIESIGPDNIHRTRTATLTVKGTVELADGSEDLIPISAVIKSTSLRSDSPGNVQGLGMLRREKQQKVIINALKAVEPKIEDIEDSASTGFPSIWADIGSDELVPLSTLGGGAMQVASLILSMARARNGVALIDEIESGIHHSALVNLWKSIDIAAQQFNTQVIATTHSYDCIRAMQDALDTERTRYVRIDKRNGTAVPAIYAPDTLDAALDSELEVR